MPSWDFRLMGCFIFGIIGSSFLMPYFILFNLILPIASVVSNRYYDRLYVEESLSLDDALVKEYFPVDVVVPTILEIYQDLLGVKFEEVKGNLWFPGAH